MTTSRSSSTLVREPLDRCRTRCCERAAFPAISSSTPGPARHRERGGVHGRRRGRDHAGRRRRSTDSRTVDEITALLTIDGGGADYTGTLTAVNGGGTTVTDFNAAFPTVLPDAIDLRSLAVDIMTQTNVGQLAIERDGGGVPTGRLFFTPNASFSDRETFSFEYRLRDVNGHRSTYVATITAPMLDADGNRLNTYLIDVADAATRSAHLVSAIGLYLEVLNADGTVKRTGTITANTATTLTVVWTGGWHAGGGDQYRSSHAGRAISSPWMTRATRTTASASSRRPP
jgi:hypothetical protein